MVTVALITSFASIVGVIGAAIFTYRTNRKAQGLTEKDMQWKWAMDRINKLEQDIKEKSAQLLDAQQRLTQADQRMNTMQQHIDKCEEDRRGDKVQIALLERLLDERGS